jgi:hypothetical protein
MKYAIEMGSGGTIYEYLPSFMKSGSGIEVILGLLPQKFYRLQCCYCRWEEFMKYAVEVDSGAMVYIPGFRKIGSGVQKLLGG